MTKHAHWLFLLIAVAVVGAVEPDAPAVHLAPVQLTDSDLAGFQKFCTTGGTFIVVGHPIESDRFATVRIDTYEHHLQSVNVSTEWGWFAHHVEMGCYRIGRVNARAEVYRLRLGYP